MRTNNLKFEFADKFGFKSPFANDCGKTEPEFYTGPIDFKTLCDDINLAKGIAKPFDYKNYAGFELDFSNALIPISHKKLRIEPDNGESYKLKLDGKLNTRKGAICSASIFVKVDINAEKRNLKITKIVKYENTPPDDHCENNFAIQISCSNVGDYELLSRYVGSYGHAEIKRAFISAINTAGDDRRQLKFIFENAPDYVLQYFEENTLWSYLERLVEYGKTSSDPDPSKALLNILALGFKNPRFVYDKLIGNPKMVMELYERIDGGSTMPFCQLLTALCLMYGTEKVQNVKKLSRGGRFILQEDSPEGADKSQNVYFFNKSDYLAKAAKSVLKDDLSDPEYYIPDAHYRFGPMDIVELYDADEGMAHYMCALAVKKFIADKNRAATWRFIFGVVTFISFFTSVGILIRGASLLIRTAAIVDIVTTTVSEVIKIPAVEKWLKGSAAGRWFLANWDTISMCANFGVMSPILIEGLIKKGPAILRGLAQQTGEAFSKFYEAIRNLYTKIKVELYIARYNKVFTVRFEPFSVLLDKFGDSIARGMEAKGIFLSEELEGGIRTLTYEGSRIAEGTVPELKKILTELVAKRGEDLVKYIEELLIKVHFDDIAEFRKLNRLPIYAVEGATGTIAKIEVEGKVFYGISSKLSKNSLPLRNKWFRKIRWVPPKKTQPSHIGRAQSLLHAEAHALISGFEVLKKLPEKLILFVDRPTCNMCKGELPALMKELGITELTIFSGPQKTKIVLTINF